MVQYAGRGGWTLRVNTGIDLEDLAPPVKQVLVKNTSTGETATLEMDVEAPASNGVLSRSVVDADFPTPGAWVVHSNVRRTSDANLLPPGAAAYIEIHELYQ